MFNLSRFNSSLLAAVPLKEFGFDTSQLAAGWFIEPMTYATVRSVSHLGE